MNREELIRMAREAGFEIGSVTNAIYAPTSCETELERFAALVAAAEREQITDEWSMCVQSDLENGVKSLNEQAAKDWLKNYPEIAKFGEWLAARGQA